MEDGVRVDSHWQRRGGLGTMLPLACSVGWAPAPPAPQLPGLVNSHESLVSPLMFQARTWWPRSWACLCPEAGASQADPDLEQRRALKVTAAEQAPGHWHSLTFWGLRGRQLSSPSHTPPDPRRKQRDSDKWPAFFPFLLGHCVPSLPVGCLESLFCPWPQSVGKAWPPKRGGRVLRSLKAVLGFRCLATVSLISGARREWGPSPQSPATPPRGLALGLHWPSAGSLPMVTWGWEVFPAPCPCVKELPAPEES